MAKKKAKKRSGHIGGVATKKRQPEFLEAAVRSKNAGGIGGLATAPMAMAGKATRPKIQPV